MPGLAWRGGAEAWAVTLLGSRAADAGMPRPVLWDGCVQSAFSTGTEKSMFKPWPRTLPEPAGLPASSHTPSGSAQDTSPARAIQSQREVRGQRALQGRPGD